MAAGRGGQEFGHCAGQMFGQTGVGRRRRPRARSTSARRVVNAWPKIAVRLDGEERSDERVAA